MDSTTQLHAAFLQATEKKDIEELGRMLTVSQFLGLLTVCAELTEGMRQRLNPLLVGVSHELFYYSLIALSKPQLQVLCRVADDEPLQYHLTLLIHELFNQAERCAESIETIGKDIQAFDVTKSTQVAIETFRHRIQQAADFFATAFKRIDIALAMAWNSNREEIIDKLTTLKENWLRYVAHELGAPASDSHPARGIYLALDQHFGAVFSGQSEEHPLATLSDTDFAFDALTALSIWYVEDYWEVGLLPGIERAEDLQLDPQRYDQFARRDLREKLTTTAKENLATLGLLTVADLKNKDLYSRRMLMHYIRTHQSQLKPFVPG